MTLFAKILQLLNVNLIYSLTAMIVTLLIIQAVFKNNSSLKKTYILVKWVLLIYASLNAVYFITNTIFFPNESAFINRAIGKYGVNYWLMFLSTLVLPFTLLYKKIGTNPLYLLFVSIMIKLGWYFEMSVIFLADYSVKQFNSEIDTEGLNSPMSLFYIVWLQGFILALLSIGCATLIDRFKKKYSSAI